MLHIIPALKDNYIWLFEIAQKKVIIIDPGEAQSVIHYIKEKNLVPIAILLTHHHDDHIAGVPELQRIYDGISVFGPDEIPLPISKISNQNSLVIDRIELDIIQVPGHTLGHLAYLVENHLFCGDTLFSAGCGRVFEGTYEQMFDSLNKLKNLDANTIVCPAHEYTLSNLKFANHLVPDDKIIEYNYQLMQNKEITLPTTIQKERNINLFLRCDDKKLQEQFKIYNSIDLFIYFRTQKNIF